MDLKILTLEEQKQINGGDVFDLLAFGSGLTVGIVVVFTLYDWLFG